MVAFINELWWVVVKSFCGFLSNDVVTFAQEFEVAIGQALWRLLVKSCGGAWSNVGSITSRYSEK